MLSLPRERTSSRTAEILEGIKRLEWGLMLVDEVQAAGLLRARPTQISAEPRLSLGRVALSVTPTHW